MALSLWIEHGATASSVAVTLDMVRLAQRCQPDRDWRLEARSTRGGPVQLADGLVLETLPHLPVETAEAVLLPGFFAFDLPGLLARLDADWRPVLDRLRALPEGTLVGASCYGTFVLAESGLLDDRAATTTWWFAEAFRRRYPQIRLDADRALVDDGRTLTAGAMTAHTDLVLHLLRRLGGAALARQVGGIMLVEGARASQRPFMSLPRQFVDPLADSAARWMEARAPGPVSMAALARALNVSPRTLHRRFSEAAGMGPLAWLQALRIERAKECLETTDADLGTITEQVGYDDLSSFGRLFKRGTGLSPAQYRRRFRGLLSGG